MSPPQFEKPRFTVGSNDKAAERRYADRYEHSTGKCGDNLDCALCTDDENRAKVIRRRENAPPRIRVPRSIVQAHRVRRY